MSQGPWKSVASGFQNQSCEDNSVTEHEEVQLHNSEYGFIA